MKILRFLTALAAVAVLTAGCCPCRSYQKKTRRPLEGTAWQLVQLNGRTIKPEAGKFSLTFHAADRQVAGQGACNRLFGHYTPGEKGALKIGPLGATRMACPGMDKEQEFAKVLESTTHYQMDGPMLMLLCEGTLQAVFQSLPDAPAAR